MWRERARDEHPTLFKAARVYLKFRRPPERIRFVLNAIAKGLSEEANEPSRVEVADGDLVLSIEYCAACWEREADRRVCHVNVGFAEEAGQWAAGEKVAVSEISCRALGDEVCRYRVRLESEE